MSDPVSYFAQALPYAGALLAGLEGGGRGGLALNVALALCAVPASLALGLKVPVLAGLAMALTEFAKWQPLLLTVFWIHYALPVFLGVRIGLFATAQAALVFYGSVNVAEVYRSGVLSVNRAELEAARLSGLSRLQTAALVLAPQAMRRMVPALLAVAVSLFKDTSVVFVIGLVELTQTGMIIAGRRPDLLPAMYAFMGLGYMAVSLVLTRLSRTLERRCEARLAGGSRMGSRKRRAGSGHWTGRTRRRSQSSR